jgi:PAS domain S-box-containing protein
MPGRSDAETRLAAELEEARQRITELEKAGGARFCGELVERLLDGFSLLTPDGVHLDVNPALCEMTGFSRDELVGCGPPHPYWPPEEGAAIQAAFQDTLEGRPATFPLTFMRKGGERFPVLVTPSVICDADGAMISAFATVKDVTALRQAEAALVESEQLFRLTFDQAPIGAALVGLDFRFRRVNARFAQMTGYSMDELLELGFPDITHPDDVAADVVEVERLAAGELGEYARQKRYVRKDGGVAWGDVVVRPVAGEGSRPLAFIAMVADVTERRAAEEKLRAGEAQLRALVEQAPIGIYLTDANGGCTLVNARWSQMAGLSQDEALGQGWLRGLHPDDRATIGDRWYRSAQSAGAWGFEYRFRDRAGKDTWVYGTAAPLRDSDGQLIGYVGVNTDITARKAAEEEIRRLNAELERRVVSRTEQLDATTRELEALAYSIAHDVRAPLRTIDGFSALVIEDERERLSPEGVAELRRVRVAAQTLARLLDELMGLSNVSSRDLLRQPVDVSALAERVGEEVAAESPSRSVELTVMPGLSADADPALLRLILRELLGNAWKFSRGRAKAHVEVGALDEGDERAFYVRDDGAGFDMRYAEHLFGAFQRMHSPEEFEGVGIGLATVHRLVRRHGGRCWAEAEVENGATIYFTLPGRAQGDKEPAGA